MHTGITQVIFLVFCTYSYTQNNCIYIFNCKSYTQETFLKKGDAGTS